MTWMSEDLQTPVCCLPAAKKGNRVEEEEDFFFDEHQCWSTTLAQFRVLAQEFGAPATGANLTEDSAASSDVSAFCFPPLWKQQICGSSLFTAGRPEEGCLRRLGANLRPDARRSSRLRAAVAGI